MENLTRYQQIAEELIQTCAEETGPETTPGIEKMIIADAGNGQYQLLRWGWDNGHRAKWMVLYFRLKNDKFWIEQDMTEDGIANRLLAAGVPKEDIVLAFHEPAMRQYTEFAAA